MATPQWQVDASTLNDQNKLPDAPVAQTANMGATTLATPSTYSATAAASPDKYTTKDATANNWNITAPQTVSSQVKGLIDANSPLQQQAETRANLAMNNRGLLNSSMAVGAAQDAVINAATPIAQADASINANAAQFNANAANAATQFNAGQQNQAARDKFSVDNQTALNNAQSINQANAQNAQQAQAASQLNAQQSNAMTQAQFDSGNKLAMFNADAAAKQILAQSENNLKTVIAMADKDTREYLGALSANTQSLTTTNAGAATLFNNYITQMSAVMTADKLDVAGKQAAIDNLKTGLKDSLAIQGAIADLDLVGLLV